MHWHGSRLFIYCSEQAKFYVEFELVLPPVECWFHAWFSDQSWARSVCSRICNEGRCTTENKQQTLQSSGSFLYERTWKSWLFLLHCCMWKMHFQWWKLQKKDGKMWEVIQKKSTSLLNPFQPYEEDTEGVFLHENLIFLWSQDHIIMVMAPALLH